MASCKTNSINGTRKVRPTVYQGVFVHSTALDELDICEKGLIGVDEHGKIAFIERDPSKDPSMVAQEHGWDNWDNCDVIKAPSNAFFFPGFIDTHTHASQYPNAGIFGKSTLLDWLHTYTFPLEGSLDDLAKAQHVYNHVVSRTLSHGTTTAAYYATIHVAATNLLASICKERGQRAFVGRVCMDMMSPDYYRDESVEQAIARSKACINYVREIDPKHDLVTPVITPRFAPSCTAECLEALGDLHRSSGYPAQTHIAENKPEIALVAKLFPQSKSYAHVYDDAGLLTDKMILAHAVHLSDAETKLIRQRRAKISHCPASNTALTSGCAKIRHLLNHDIDIGLGTDVSGGFSPSILEMARQAIWVSRHVAMSDGDLAKLSTEEVLYLATRGGAKVVGLEGKVGGFDVGMEWDAQMISMGDEVDVDAETYGERDGPVDIFGWESWEERVQKWVYGGDDRNTVAVWVRGRLVHKTSRYRPHWP